MDVPLASTSDEVLRELAALSNAPALKDLSAQQLLMERAHLNRASFRDGRSTGGSCRFLPTADTPIALNLPRPSDWDLLPAWLELDPFDRDWDALAHATAGRDSATLVERGRWLGLAIASIEPIDSEPIASEPIAAGPVAPPRGAAGGRPTVIDLSALWAGPLCTHLLQLCGAEVVKVESGTRPDGARFGHSGFYALLNQGKRSVGLDFNEPDDRRILHALIASADIVVESSRPRALAHLGLEATSIVAQHPGLTWLSITGYGRSEPRANWIAFGDDAGVAAGLSEVMREVTGTPQFVGDAIADPLTGIHAALAAWQGWLSGGGLIDLSMTRVVADSLARESDYDGFSRWWWHATHGDPSAGIRKRSITEAVRPLGCDTADVLAERGIAC